MGRQTATAVNGAVTITPFEIYTTIPYFSYHTDQAHCPTNYGRFLRYNFGDSLSYQSSLPYLTRPFAVGFFTAHTVVTELTMAIFVS